MEKLIDFLKINAIDYRVNEPMNKHTTFKVGGDAQVYVTVKNNSELCDVLKFVKENEIEYFIIGKGSNLLVSDNGIKGIVIALGGELEEIKLLDEETIYAGAGASLMKVCRFALENSLSGLEFAYGIPGSVGGALYMNAGAYGGEINDVIYSAECITSKTEKNVILKGEMSLGYRTSVFKTNNNVITSAVFKLHKADKENIKSQMEDYMERRKTKQPLEYPSAGSTFKRPKGAFAGALIEQCGLKGKSIGGAEVSEKHAGFVINKNNATAKDINELIDFVQKKVKEETGYYLETEVIRL
jgi:UDP-N-acetylmuramate dehydrogenase